MVKGLVDQAETAARHRSFQVADALRRTVRGGARFKPHEGEVDHDHRERKGHQVGCSDRDREMEQGPQHEARHPGAAEGEQQRDQQLGHLRSPRCRFREPTRLEDPRPAEPTEVGEHVVAEPQPSTGLLLDQARRASSSRILLSG